MRAATAAAGFQRWGWEAAAILVSLLAAAVRLLPWPKVFVAGDVVPQHVDDYYHLWRAEGIAATFPHAAWFDPYLSFPRGAPVPWPLGFDTLLALPGILGFSSQAIAVWSALLMPVLGGVAVYLTYRLGRALFGPLAGVAAALVLALMRDSILTTMVGHIDHHALVAPVSLGIFLTCLAALRARGSAGQVGWGLGCGFLAGAAVSGWVMTPPLYFLPVPATLMLCRGRLPQQLLRRVSLATLGSAFLFVTVAVFVNSDLGLHPFSLYHPSHLTILLYLVFALLGCAWQFGWRQAAGSLALLAGAIAVPGLWPRILAPVRQGLDLASRSDPALVHMASENLGLFFFTNLGSRFNIAYAVHNFSYLILLTPLFLGTLLWRLRRSGERSPGNVLFAGYAFLGFGLLLLMIRFDEFATPALALLFAQALVEGGRRMLDWSRATPRRTLALPALLLAASAAIFALSPLLTSLPSVGRAAFSGYNQELVAFARELGRLLPPSPPQGQVPPHGVLARWGDSHVLLQALRLPVMVSSLGPDAVAQNKAGFRILLSPSEESALRALRENRIRYLVLSQIFTSVEPMALTAGLGERFVDVQPGQDGKPPNYRPLPPFLRSLHSRLYLADGSLGELAGVSSPALQHFRLLAETSQTHSLLGLSRPRFMAFEVVEGARVTGVAPAGSSVQLALPLLASSGRPFTYSNQTTAGADGRFLFVVPYATTGGKTATRARGPYEVRTAERSYRAAVSETEIQTGATVLLR